MLTRDDFLLALRPDHADFSRADEFLSSAGLERPVVLSSGTLALSVVRMNQLTLLRVVAPSLSVMWRRQRLAAHERRAILLVEAGEMAVECGDFHGVLMAGSALVIDPGHDSVGFVFRASVTRAYVLTADRNVLDSNLMDRTDRLTIFRPEHASFTGVITTLLGSVIATAAPELGPVLSAGIGNILRSAANEISAQARRAEGALPNAYDLALATIHTRSSDPAFDPERLAFALGMRLRTLQQRFAESGTSIAVEIRRSRVRTAVRVLREDSRLPLEAVVRLSGFASIAVLRAALRTELGTTPAELRRQDPELWSPESPSAPHEE